VTAGTGDSQRDALDDRARTDAVSARDVVARELYRLLWPTLDWPEGKTKRAKEARQSAQIAADRILERIGRPRYQDALDACHLLLTDPNENESKWLGKAQSVYAVIDMVTSRVDELRRDAATRQEQSERQAAMLERQARATALTDYKDAAKPSWYGTESQLWKAAKDMLASRLARATYDTWIAKAELIFVYDDGRWLIQFEQQDPSWADTRLRPVIERAVTSAAGHPVPLEFVGPTEVVHVREGGTL
jgi:hypothetical protein